MNTVDVDEPAIAAELSSLTGQPAENLQPGNADPQPGGAAPPGPAMPAPSSVDWTIASVGLVNIFDRGIAPNWNLSDDEKRGLVEPLNQVFVAFFPNLHLDPRWQAAGVLVMAVGAIAYSRVDPQTGELRPLRIKPAPADDEDLERRADGARATA